MLKRQTTHFIGFENTLTSVFLMPCDEMLVYDDGGAFSECSRRQNALVSLVFEFVGSRQNLCVYIVVICLLLKMVDGSN